MEKKLASWTISKLLGKIDLIDFPEFQREPSVWGLEKKKLLIDSIVRGIDISLIYLVKGRGDTMDCIDGRQRINSILSYLGINKDDENHNGFNLQMENEVYDDKGKWSGFEGKRFENLAQIQKDAILNYELNVVLVDNPDNPEDLNLMFLRLQLGAPLRGGEKLHAMSGEMKDFVFAKLSQHEYFNKLTIANKRYAKELVAAQLLQNAYNFLDTQEFGRSRFEDLQTFFRGHAKLTKQDNGRNSDILRSTDEIVKRMGDKIPLIRNRGLAVSVFLFVWSELISQNRSKDVATFGNFLDELLKELKVQVEKAKRMEIDPNYKELLSLQTSLVQGTGDASSFQYRQAFFADYFDYFLKKKSIKKTAKKS